MSTLERAIAIAAKVHAGQVDKAGAPYILHPIRVMMKVSTPEERIAAVLHDVIEDSDHTFEGLRREGFSEEIVEAIDALTRRREESYMEFVTRAGANPIARRVKIADLEDNCDLSRIKDPKERDYKRLEKYREALRVFMQIDREQ